MQDVIRSYYQAELENIASVAKAAAEAAKPPPPPKPPVIGEDGEPLPEPPARERHHAVPVLLPSTPLQLSAVSSQVGDGVCPCSPAATTATPPRDCCSLDALALRGRADRGWHLLG